MKLLAKIVLARLRLEAVVSVGVEEIHKKFSVHEEQHSQLQTKKWKMS